MYALQHTNAVDQNPKMRANMATVQELETKLRDVRAHVKQLQSRRRALLTEIDTLAVEIVKHLGTQWDRYPTGTVADLENELRQARIVEHDADRRTVVWHQKPRWDAEFRHVVDKITAKRIFVRRARNTYMLQFDRSTGIAIGNESRIDLDATFPEGVESFTAFKTTAPPTGEET